jgi:hypothetical protein
MFIILVNQEGGIFPTFLIIFATGIMAQIAGV